jgi:RHS repeat-associated protein
MPQDPDLSLDLSLQALEPNHPSLLPPLHTGDKFEEGLLAPLGGEQAVASDWENPVDSLPLDAAILDAVQAQSEWGEQVSRNSWGQTAPGVDDIINAAQRDLQAWFRASDWKEQLTEILGDRWEQETAETLAQGVVQGHLPLKAMVQIVSDEALPTARGGFDSLTNTIYLAAGFVEGYRHHPESIKAVLIEEFGHYLDAQLNQRDTPGDEGERFAAIVMGLSLSQAEFQNIQAESDVGVLVLNGAVHWIEQSAPSFAIKTEGTFTMNGSGDLDGDPLNLLDDALVYAAKGYTINGNPALPVQRDAAGNVIRDANGKPLLVPNAVTVSPGYTVLNGPTNKYAGLNPPTAIPLQQIEIPVYADLRNQTLRDLIPAGTPEIIFDASRNPLNSLSDWNSKFPTGGTTTQPKVVRVINGGLNIPKDADLSNMVITVENGAINFNGTGNDFSNVVLIANNGNINLNTVNASNLKVFASGAVNMNGAARFGGLDNLIATGTSNGHVTFNGSTRSWAGADQIRVIAQGNITFNGSSNTRAKFTSVGTFTFNGASHLYGAIAAKSNIIFNGSATVIYAGIVEPNPNQAPSDIQLSGNRVAENVPANTSVGTLSTTDGNAGDTHNYQLVAGTGDTDNGVFVLAGNQLQVERSPDFETQGSYSIRVRSTDQGGLSTEKVFTVSVTNVNEAPISMGLSGQTIEENSGTGTVIGLLSGTDPDLGDSLSFSLVDDAEGRFQVMGNQLQVKNSSLLDFESKASHSVTIQVTDAGGLSRVQAFTISLTDVNEAPSNLQLSNEVIAENQPGNSVVGVLSVTDVDQGDRHTYSLVEGGGAADNTAFSIVGNQLHINGPADFESKASYSIRVRAVDQGGLFTDRVLTIGVLNQNEAPTVLLLSGSTVDENNVPNSLIGRFTTEDPDQGDSHLYALVTGNGDTDNATFTIVNNELRIKDETNFEAKNSYSVRVRTTDQGGLSFEQSYSIQVNDLNEAPIRVELSDSVIAENSPNGTVIGQLSTVDPDLQDHHVYSLLDDAQGRFQIVGSQLQVKNSSLLDFESKVSHSVTIQVTDAGGLSRVQAFTISLTDVNEAPSNLQLSNGVIAENETGDSVVGVLSVTDVDQGDRHTYSLVEGGGAADNTAFSIVGNQLHINGPADFESKSSYSIRVRAVDQGGLFTDRVLTIGVLNQNEAPTVLLLSGSAVDENNALNSLIGRFTTEDPDQGDSHLYALVTGNGDTDNAAFTIVNNELRIKDETNFEAKNSYSVRVRTTDQGGLSFEQSYSIQVNDLNEAPIRVELSDSVIAENSPTGTVIGQLSTVDPDLQDHHVYSLLDDAQGRFQIVDSQLQVKDGSLLDFEQNTSHSVTIQVTDAGGLSRVQAFTISLTDVNEAPVFTSTPVTHVAVGEVYAYTVTTADPDQGDGRSLSAANLPDWMKFTDKGNGTGLLSGTPGLGDIGNQTIHLTVVDSRGLNSLQTVSLEINATLREVTSFNPELVAPIVIPAQPSILQFKIDPQFDRRDRDSIRDAFEMAYVGADGKSLVHTLGNGSRSFFNLTEGLAPATAAGVTFDPSTNIVSLNLTGVTPGTSGDLVVHLVNNDDDTQSLVRIEELNWVDAPAGTTVPTQGVDTKRFQTEPLATGLFEQMEDVTASVDVQYGATRFNDVTNLLYADVTLSNIGSYGIDAPMVVAIKNISDPSVSLRNPDGFTPDGVPFYNFSSLVTDGNLNPDEMTLSRSLIFFNPNEVQFSYEVLVLAGVNRAPEILSQPQLEVRAGQLYRYAVEAQDANNDTLTYKLLAGPQGMTIDAATGVIEWQTSSTMLGAQSILIEVSDGRGESDRQAFSLKVFDYAPNRPPVITSTPILDGNVNQPYIYDVDARDPEGGQLIYRLESGPNGMSINPSTGLLQWTPDVSNLGNSKITVKVFDEQGATAEQTFTISIQGQSENHAPIIISEATTKGFVGKAYLYQVIATDPDQDVLTYKLVSGPAGMTIDQNTGLISWPKPLASNAPYDVTIQVIDPRGGTDQQTWKLDISNQGFGTISGNVLVNGLDLLGTKIPIKAILTADNHYGLYYGSVDQSTLTFIGRNEYGSGGIPGAYNWSYPETFNFEVDPNSYLYTTVWNDGGPRMFLGQFQLSEGVILNTNDMDWLSVVATGRNPGINGEVPTKSVLQNEILQAKWAVPQQSAPNVSGGTSWGFIREISSSAEFISHDSFVSSSSSDAHYVIYRTAAPIGSYFSTNVRKGVQNQIVYLDVNRNNHRDVQELFTRTDAQGNYSFNVAPGNYLIAFEPQLGWVKSATSKPSYEVALTTGQTLANIDFFTSQGRTNGETQNADPSFLSQPLTEAQVGRRFLYQAVATDADGDNLFYDLLVKPDGMVVDAKSGVIVWRPQSAHLGKNDVILRVQDNYGGIKLQSFSVYVDPENQKPVFTTSSPGLTPIVGRPYYYQFRAVDPEGEKVTFHLDSPDPNATLNPVTGEFTWTPQSEQYFWTANGKFPFTIKATDPEGNATRLLFELAPKVQGTANTAPIILSAPRTNLKLGEVYSYQLTVQDLDNDPLSYSLTQNPSGMTIDQQGRVSWVPLASQWGQHEVTVQVSDGHSGNTQQSFILNVGDQSVNTIPKITSAPALSANIGRMYIYDLQGRDSDGDEVVWSLEQSPAGMVIDPQTGALRWQPTSAQIGEHQITVRLMDRYGLYDLQSYTLKVTGTNSPPNIVSTPNTNATLNKLYTYTVVATDTENDVLRYALLKSPKGMTINATTGLISWIPQSIHLGGGQAVEVQVLDSQGGATTQAFWIYANSTTSNQAPIIASTPKIVATLGQPYQYQIQASDPEGGALVYKLIEGPKGMAIDSTTGLVNWNSPLAGTYPVVVEVLDTGGIGIAQAFTLTAKANGAPVIRSIPGTNATPGIEYRYDLVARDPDGDRLTYGLDAASQAIGMRLDSLGRLRWTPKANQLGNHAVTLMVTDAAGATVTQAFTLTVTADTEAPKIRLIGSTNLADVGDALFFQARATDNIGIQNLQLFINDTPVAMDGNGVVQLKAEQPGPITARAIAFDLAGNRTETTTTIQVLDPRDTQAPTINLDLSGIADGVINGPTSIRGTVTDTNLDYYVLEVAPADGSGSFQEVFRGTDNVSDGVLGTFDPTLLQNDAYTLRLSAFDTNGQGTTTEQLLNVTGDLKLGNFRLSFTDLAIPVTGIPITVTRTYDTLTTGYKDDFGYGWRLEFRDTDLRVNLPKDKTYELFDIRSVGFKEGTKVFITLPGGVREAFTFKPTIDPISRFLPSAGESADTNLYHAAFVSAKGVTSTLSIPGADSRTSWLIRTDDGTFVSLGGQKYNPGDSYFGGVYQLTTKEGVEYRIDGTTGDLLQVKDPNGNTLTYTDSAITSSTGKQVTFGRDAQGRITSVTDPNGNQVKYTYNTEGDLVSVRDLEGNVTKFVYDTQYDDPNYPGVDDVGRTKRNHFLREVIDPQGRTGARMEYDEKGRLKRTLNTSGNSVAFEYDPANSVQTVRDALGNPTTYEYDPRGNVVRQVDALGNQTRLKYDDNNNMIEIIDPNNLVTRMTYDSKGNLISRTEAYCGCAGVVPGSTYYTYDARGNMTDLVLPTGASLNLTYDPRGNLLSVQDGKGNVIQSFTYDRYGQVKSETDVSGTSRYYYDEFGNLVLSIDSDGGITRMDYDNNGRMIKMVEDNGTPNDTSDDETSTFTYDKLGRETRADYGNGIWVEYGYTGASGDWTTLNAPTIGRIERKLTEDGKLAGWVTPDGGTPSFIYDTLGRLWKETDASGRVTTEYGYDAAGRLNSIKDVATGATTTRRYDAGGRLIEEIDPLGGFSRSVFNSRTGRLDQSERGQYRRNDDGTLFRDAKGDLVVDTAVPVRIWRYEYNGLRTTVIDPLGRRTTSVQDDYSLPTKTIFEQRNGRNYQTQVEYLYANNLQEAKDFPTRIVDIGGNDRVFGYDSDGRLISATDLGDNVTNYTYGEDGLAEIKGPTGETLGYNYDALGNLSAILYGDGSRKLLDYRDTDNRLGTITLPSGETVTYTYDEAGRVTNETTRSAGGVITGSINYVFDDNGKLQSVTNDTDSTVYEFDPQTGRLASITTSNGSGVAYTYDLFGRVQTQTEWAKANGPRFTTTYSYDTFGNLTSVLDPAGGLTTMTYDVGNRLTSRSLPNGIVTSYSYDDLDRVASITHKQGNTVLASVTYERNGIGEPSKITREDGSYVTLSYDASLRLTEEKYHSPAGVLTETISYSYNAAGQRTAKVDRTGTDTYRYKPGFQLDAITGTGDEDYSYDTDGRLNLIQRNGTTLDFDHDTYNRIASISSSNGEQTTYLYDAQGRRIGEQVGNQQRRYLVTPIMGGGLDSQDLISDGSGNVLSNFVYAGGTTPFMRLDANGNPIYYLTDALGSVIGLADGSGAEIADFHYDGFGNLRSTNGSGTSDPSLGGDFRFHGQWLESESGLYYFRARDYDTQSGLFLQRDPVDIIETEPESMNPYQFVYNNPYIYTDPTGMFTITELNITQKVRDVLNSINNRVQGRIANKIINEAKGVVTDILSSAIERVVPWNDAIQIYSSSTQGTLYEKFMQGTFCSVMSSVAGSFVDNIWLEVGVDSSGLPQNNGRYRCGSGHVEQVDGRRGPSSKYSNPDFIFKKGGPASTAAVPFPPKGDPAFLIGDFKRGVTSIKTSGSGSNQWRAIMNYARAVWQIGPLGMGRLSNQPGQQYVPVALYVTLYDNPGREKSLQAKAMRDHGVDLRIISFLPKR